jgi:putative transposase
MGDQETHRKTCRRYNDPGDAHELTFSCFKRRAFLSREVPRQYLIEAMLTRQR